jgi:hypothetical protein
MSRHAWPRLIALSLFVIILITVSACSVNFLSPSAATPTPTKTPHRATATAMPTAAEAIVPELPTATPPPTAAPTVAPTATMTPTIAATPTIPPAAAATAVPPTVAPVKPAATAIPPTAAPPTAPPPTAAPATDFAITELRVLGLNENNGGIEGPGAGRTIFITVLDAAGKPVNNAVLVNIAPYPGRAVTGDKGPGKAELLMDREEFRLKIESVDGQTVTSETSHTMSLIAPVPADIAGKLGAACPTVDNCPLPPYKHFSYVITFRRTH